MGRQAGAAYYHVKADPTSRAEQSDPHSCLWPLMVQVCSKMFQSRLKRGAEGHPPLQHTLGDQQGYSLPSLLDPPGCSLPKLSTSARGFR